MGNREKKKKIERRNMLSIYYLNMCWTSTIVLYIKHIIVLDINNMGLDITILCLFRRQCKVKVHRVSRIRLFVVALRGILFRWISFVGQGLLFS